MFGSGKRAQGQGQERDVCGHDEMSSRLAKLPDRTRAEALQGSDLAPQDFTGNKRPCHMSDLRPVGYVIGWMVALLGSPLNLLG